MTDIEKLVESARAGEGEAFAEIVKRYQGMALAYAYSLLGDFPLAEDAAQEAFVKAYQDLRMLKEPGRFAAWLRRLVFKQCDRIRRRRRAKTVPIESAGEPASPLGEPHEAAAGREMRRSVLEAVRALGEKERTATMLFYVDGYSQAEVAGFLEVPVSTVKSRLHSARQELKGRLLAMVEDAVKSGAPDDSFARRVEAAIAAYTARGPEQDSIGSAWHGRILDKTGELLESGEEGFRVAVALSQAAEAKARSQAAVYFALARDERGREYLERLLEDESPKVRRTAVRAYATLIHPESGQLNAMWEIAKPASSVPSSVKHIAAMLEDEDVKVRWYATLALGAYAPLRDGRVDEALQKALADGAHKVQHAAARILGAPCPSCGGPSAE